MPKPGPDGGRHKPQEDLRLRAETGRDMEAQQGKKRGGKGGPGRRRKTTRGEAEEAEETKRQATKEERGGRGQTANNDGSKSESTRTFQEASAEIQVAKKLARFSPNFDELTLSHIRIYFFLLLLSGQFAETFGTADVQEGFRTVLLFLGG